MPSTGLQMPQWMDNLQLLPHPPDLRINCQGPRGEAIHLCWPQTGVQQCLNQKGGWMESCVHHESWALWANCHVLWANKLPSNLSNHDECNLHQRNHRRMANHLHGKYSSGHKRWPTVPWAMHPQNAQETPGTWPVPQTREVLLWATKNWIPRHNPRKWNSTNGPSESLRHSRLAPTSEHNWHTIIPRFHRILPLLYPQLFKHCPAPDPINLQKCPLWLGPVMPPCLQMSQNPDVCQTHPTATRLFKSLLPCHWHIHIWHGHHTLTRGRTQSMNTPTHALSSCLLLQHLHPSQMQLWHLWKRIPGCPESTQMLQTPCSSYRDPCYHPHRPH